jgi:UDP-glucose:(heptosyl)LPS alpha-1,3-glucosyltransferase
MTYHDTMRVAMSSSRFNQQGGIERASYEVANGLAALGQSVTLVAQDIDPDPQALEWLKVDLAPGPDFLTPWRYPRAATRRIRGRSFDIVHNQGGCALRGQDVITAHSCHRAWWQMKFRQGEAARAVLNPRHHVVLHVERANYRPGAFRRVIAVSAGVGRELGEHYGVPPELVTVIPNGVDSDRFQPADAAARRQAVRQRHGFADSDVVLLFVGKEFRRKGLGALVESLPHIPEHVKVLVVGGDDQAPFDALARRLGVRDRVAFAGHTTATEDYFQAGDVFMLPTLYEAFALVTLEAAAAGLPLVTTEVNGTEDFVVSGQNGFFIGRTPQSIAAALKPLIESPDLRRRLGEEARRRVRGYTWESVAARTLEVYERVAAESAPVS